MIIEIILDISFTLSTAKILPIPEKNETLLFARNSSPRFLNASSAQYIIFCGASIKVN